MKLRYMGLMWRKFLSKCLYLIGIWQGLDLRMDTQQDMFYDIDLCVQHIDIILGFNNEYNQQSLCGYSKSRKVLNILVSNSVYNSTSIMNLK